jgi:DNA-binding NtrC family response regulator
VLVVDDEPAVLRSIVAVLSTEFAVVSAASAEEALLQLERREFHVVCTDFHLPGMNGLQLLAAVAALPYPVGSVLLTGTDEYAGSNHWREGARHYVLLKPYDPDRLVGLVAQLARLAEMRRSVRALKREV